VSQHLHEIAMLASILGLVVIAALLAKALFERIGVPAIIGYLLIGLALSLVQTRTDALSEQGDALIDLLGQIGIFILLFGVGLDSDPRRLFSQIGRASPIWIGSVLVSGAAGYAAARWALGFDVIPSIVVGVALTATSVGVSSSIWQDEQAIQSDEGQLFVDVAELDDLSGVILIAVLFATLVSIRASAGESEAVSPDVFTDPEVWQRIGVTGALMLGKLVLLAGGCYLFARFLEAPLMNTLERFERGPDPVISATGVGLAIAGVAGLLGFSLAIGGFFAGLAFCLRSEEIRERPSFQALHALFVPFFLISVGARMAPESLGPALWPGLALFVAAFLGKFIGTAAPALLTERPRAAALLGVSMIPRAEIALVIATGGLALGGWALPEPLYAGLVLAAAATCLTAPFAIRPLIRSVVSQE